MPLTTIAVTIREIELAFGGQVELLNGVGNTAFFAGACLKKGRPCVAL
jgi:hypothetical protein